MHRFTTTTLSQPYDGEQNPWQYPMGQAAEPILEPLPFDGRLLGADFSRRARPLPELMLFGRMMITRGEAAQLLRADRSPAAMWLGMRLLTVSKLLTDRGGPPGRRREMAGKHR